MSQYVFILGAGASRNSGAPLMGDFLEKARGLYSVGAGSYNPPFDVVQHALARLQVVHSKADVDLYNLEPVFGVFEMGRLLGRLPGFENQEEVDGLVRALRIVIAETLEKLITYPCDNVRPHAPSEYMSFGDLIKIIMDRVGSDSCSVITFNYDVLTEFALMDAKVSFHYGLPEGTGLKIQRQVPLLKLHGSLNWMSCQKCKRIVPVDIVQEVQRRPWIANSANKTTVPISDFLRSAGFHCCGQPVNSPPVIVPPTWNKTEYAASLGAVWKEAAKELSQAENIFVSGYSLPETDTFFKHLFALGAVGSHLINRFWVFDPDHDGSVEKRFSALLGKAVTGRFRMFSRSTGVTNPGFVNLIGSLLPMLGL